MQSRQINPDSGEVIKTRDTWHILGAGVDLVRDTWIQLERTTTWTTGVKCISDEQSGERVVVIQNRIRSDIRPVNFMKFRSTGAFASLL